MEGIRIVDLSRVLAGPWATMHLADQGAEVIKVEPPGGDDTRSFGPHVDGVSTYYLSANRNKRSVMLDLRQPEGREVLYDLVRSADAVVQNYRPGVAERLGCGWEELSAIKPDLVFVAIHAFGDSGPFRDRPGYDLVLQAAGGAMALTGHPGAPPTKCGTSIADLTTGQFTVQALLMGLLHKARTGEGQKIVVNMMAAQAHALAYHATRASIGGSEDVQRGNSHGGLAPYNVYRCSDGWLALGCGNDAIFARLCDALGLQPKAQWSTNPGRVEDRTALDTVVQAALEGLTVAEADERMAAAGVPAGPVNTPREAFEHPAVPHIQIDHPKLGEITMVAPVFQTKTTVSTHRPPPALDADRAAVIRETRSSDGHSRS